MSNSLPEILITKKYPREIIELLKPMAIVHQWDRHPYNLMPRKEVLKKIERLTAIINQAELRVDNHLLEKGKHLKIITNVSIGVDNLDLELMNEKKIWGTNTPGYFDYPVAEYVIGGIITVMRKLREADTFIRSGQWNSFQPGRWDGESLRGKTLGIIGMGNIARSVARLARAFGMDIYCFSSANSAKRHGCVSLEKVLSMADVISVHVPYTPATHEMFNLNLFGMMKSGVIFVNTSRGKVIKEKDLIDQLKAGHIGGAVLDVFAQEPKVPELLKRMSNVLLTPHIAGGTKSGRLACYKMAVKDVCRVLKGEIPIHPVNNPYQ
ncbi:MAG: hypothetical protein MI975_06845 [Cytophagales bacterium]|nr:hypothetical protein [Cytophagales bacterium]